ncbi:MAG: YraN family protein [Bacteroidota bacterium]
MAKNKEIGERGEQIAVDFLEAKDYKILERNWRFSRAEVDIIAMDGEVLVFLEVKTRSYTFFGEPAAFVTEKKEALMIDAAHVYMEKIGHEWEIRFDIIGIVLPKQGETDIRHFEDAFFPTW